MAIPSTHHTAAEQIRDLADRLATALKAENDKPDRFTTACLALATRAAAAEERSYAEVGQWTAALVETLKWDLLYASPGGPPGGMAETNRRAREEAARLIDWARKNPEELNLGYSADFTVWDS